MGGVLPETCCASYKYGIIKFWYIVASCWIFLNELYYNARIHEHQLYRVAEKSPYTDQFFPIQQCRSSWWSLIKPFPDLGHGLSRVLSLTHPHTCHQALLDRVTTCVSHTENTTKFCGCGKSRVHYLAHCCQLTILHCTACCAVQCKLILSLRCVMSGCTVTSRPPCIAVGRRRYKKFRWFVNLRGHWLPVPEPLEESSYCLVLHLKATPKPCSEFTFLNCVSQIESNSTVRECICVFKLLESYKDVFRIMYTDLISLLLRQT
jgi:hypothetical protein